MLGHQLIQRTTSTRSIRANHHHETLTRLTRWHPFSSSSTKESLPQPRPSSRRGPILAASLAVVGVSSLYVRRWRTQHLEELVFVTDGGGVLPHQRNLKELIVLAERTGLMGITPGAKSVKEELDSIRKWHHERGYKGGLVLRELTQPLFAEDHAEGVVLHNDRLKDLALDPMRLARRECYYLYYEITGNGEIRQQIFCRGTTLLIDILTCLQLWMVHDEELGCRVHLGFRNQADRILEDLQPLLAPSTDKRSTIEVSGHSLGGAVAYLIAAKLKKRGYQQVLRVTSVAAPRFCATPASAATLQSLLPKDSLRLEHDTDFVPFLPPFGYHPAGNKLWLLGELDATAYIPASNPSPWVDNVFVNFRSWELLVAFGYPHRIPHYISHLKRLLNSKTSSKYQDDKSVSSQGGAQRTEIGKG
jgi:hypothetical protein